MYNIIYKDKDGERYVDTATAIYDGTWTREKDGEFTHKGVWVELFDEDDRIFIETEDSDALMDYAFAQGKVDTTNYGHCTWESDINKCVNFECESESCPHICAECNK